jgi:hypothetical protein
VEEGGKELAAFWKREREFWEEVDEVELDEESAGDGDGG